MVRLPSFSGVVIHELTMSDRPMVHTGDIGLTLLLKEFAKPGTNMGSIIVYLPTKRSVLKYQ